MQQTAQAPRTHPHPPLTIGDRAVDGLLRGLAGGCAMILFLCAASAFAGLGPGTVLALFGIETTVQPLNGLFSHLAVSGVYGILWGLLATLPLRRPTLPTWLYGMLYGALLYGAAAALILPTSPLARIPWPIFFVAHLVYGGVLGRMHPAHVGQRAVVRPFVRTDRF